MYVSCMIKRDSADTGSVLDHKRQQSDHPEKRIQENAQSKGQDQSIFEVFFFVFFSFFLLLNMN